MKTLTRTFAGLTAFTILSTTCFAGPGVIAKFNPNDVGTDPITFNHLVQPPVWAHDPTVTVSNYTVHGGLTLTGGNPMIYDGWDTTMNPNKYLGFTVTPNAGVQMTLTSLKFGVTNFYMAIGVVYNWAYRVDNGTGFGPWNYAPATTFDGTDNDAITWTFPTPIQTSGTVEFGFFASAPDATSSASVDTPVLNGTAGDTSPDPSLHGVISQYTDASTFLIPSVSEASAITYDWDTGTLFCVGDEGPSIVELSKTGDVVSSMSMTESKFHDGLKGDPEALSYLGEDGTGLPTLMIGAERENVAIQLTYRRNSFNTPNWIGSTPAVVFGPTNSNIGLEGVSTDRSDTSLWGIKERQSVSILHATNLGTSSQALANIDMNDINWRVGIVSLSDIYVMANSAAYAGNDHLLVLARDDNKILEITKAGQVVDTLSIAKMGYGTVEGMTMDDDGVIYLCGEQEGGDNLHNKPTMHVLRKTKHSVLSTGGRQVLLGTSADDSIYGNPAADTLTGGPGVDTFVFKSLRDGIDTITDFTPGVDVIDLTAVLASIGYTGGATGAYQPLTDGTVRVIDSPSGALVQILSAGSYRSLVLLPGLTAAQAGVASSFRFATISLN